MIENVAFEDDRNNETIIELDLEVLPNINDEITILLNKNDYKVYKVKTINHAYYLREPIKKEDTTKSRYMYTIVVTEL